jgi:hypothetical protein
LGVGGELGVLARVRGALCALVVQACVVRGRPGALGVEWCTARASRTHAETCVKHTLAGARVEQLLERARGGGDTVLLGVDEVRVVGERLGPGCWGRLRWGHLTAGSWQLSGCTYAGRVLAGEGTAVNGLPTREVRG